MNMLKEFFDYFISVMLGRQDSLTAFLEPLIMGERYLRWGLESKDIRDMRSGMDRLHLCYDRDAPMASLLIRKYNCISEITAAAVDSLLLRHNKVIDSALKAENNYREELDLVIKKIIEGKESIRRLQAEGSLIKAKGEEVRIASLEDNARHLREILASGESRSELYDSYDKITSESMLFFRELDRASSMVQTSPLLTVDMGEALGKQLRAKLDYLRDRIEQANPIPTDSGTPGQPPQVLHSSLAAAAAKAGGYTVSESPDNKPATVS